jgi:hypothetical protein
MLRIDAADDVHRENPFQREALPGYETRPATEEGLLYEEARSREIAMSIDGR